MDYQVDLVVAVELVNQILLLELVDRVMFLLFLLLKEMQVEMDSELTQHFMAAVVEELDLQEHQAIHLQVQAQVAQERHLQFLDHQ
jgi:hypothetical protein